MLSCKNSLLRLDEDMSMQVSNKKLVVYKDAFKKTSITESKRVFFVARVPLNVGPSTLKEKQVLFFSDQNCWVIGVPRSWLRDVPGISNIFTENI